MLDSEICLPKIRVSVVRFRPWPPFHSCVVVQKDVRIPEPTKGRQSFGRLNLLTKISQLTAIQSNCSCLALKKNTAQRIVNVGNTAINIVQLVQTKQPETKRTEIVRFTTFQWHPRGNL